MSYPAWEPRVKCLECGWHGRGDSASGADGAMFLWYNNICPKCGTLASRWELNFIIVPMRFILTGEWYKPWTWGQGYWEEKER